MEGLLPEEGLQLGAFLRRDLEETAVPEDRLWLHHGKALVAYPFFREVGEVVGQIGRRDLIVQRQGSGWDMVRLSPSVFRQPG